MAKKRKAKPVELADVLPEMDLASLRMAYGAFREQVEEGCELPDSLSNKVSAAPIYRNGNSILVVEVELLLLAVDEGQLEVKAEEAPVMFNAVFVATYQNSSGKVLGEEAMDAFVSNMCMSHVWPYWREFVSSSVGRMSLPQITIPFWRGFPLARPSKPAAKKRANKKAKGTKKVTKKKSSS